MGEFDRRAQEDLEKLLVLVPGDLAEPPGNAVARVVDQNVDMPHPGKGFAGEQFRRTGLAEVEGHRLDSHASLTERDRCRLEAIKPTCDQQQVMLTGGQQLGESEPDARRRAGHQRHRPMVRRGRGGGSGAGGSGHDRMESSLPIASGDSPVGTIIAAIMALSYRTAGESHGPALISLVEGLPAGLAIDVGFIDGELRRRQGGYGRGGRQRIESDAVTFLSGVRLGKTIGSPIAMQIPNRDSRLDDLERTPPVHRPRPGHADLAGSVQWLTIDCRETLERAIDR